MSHMCVCFDQSQSQIQSIEVLKQRAMLATYLSVNIVSKYKSHIALNFEKNVSALKV